MSRHKQTELGGPKTKNLDRILFVESKIVIYKNLRGGTTVIDECLKSDDKKAIGDCCQLGLVPWSCSMNVYSKV